MTIPQRQLLPDVLSESQCCPDRADQPAGVSPALGRQDLNFFPAAVRTHLGPTNPFGLRMGLDLPYLEDRALMLSAKVQRHVVDSLPACSW